MEEKNLAENISNKINMATSSLSSVYSNKDIGYIKLFAIGGFILLNLASIGNEGIGFILTSIALVMILMAMKRVDQLSTYTHVYKYMLRSVIGYVFASLMLLFLIPISSFDAMIGQYIFATIVVVIITIPSIYYYYKSYIELAKATNLAIFKTSAILVVASIVIGIASSFLSDLVFIVGGILAIIGWFGIKKIYQKELVSTEKEEVTQNSEAAE